MASTDLQWRGTASLWRQNASRRFRKAISRTPHIGVVRQLSLRTHREFRATLLKGQTLIAVVDDDPDVLQSLWLLLSACGYRTKLFASAEEFLIAAPALNPACLIIDIQLGESSGVELVRSLCKRDVAWPVIFITGSHDERHRREAIEVGCAAFLLKPFSGERLIEAVAKAIDSKLN